MFEKNKKKAREDYQRRLCLGFNGGVSIVKKITISSQPVFRAVLEALEEQHKNNPIFKGLLEGFDHESMKIRNMRSNQLKRIEKNQSKSKSNGWQR